MTSIHAAAASPPGGHLAGADTEVVVDGRRRRYVDLDTAPTTPASEAVVRAVPAFLPWCSSVHRAVAATPEETRRHRREEHGDLVPALPLVPAPPGTGLTCRAVVGAGTGAGHADLPELPAR